MYLLDFIITIVLPLCLALFVDLRFRGKAKGTTLNFISLGIYLFISLIFNWLYTWIFYSFSFHLVLSNLLIRTLAILLGILAVFIFNKLIQCQSKIIQVLISLLVFDLVWLICYGIYDYLNGYSLSVLLTLPIINTIYSFSNTYGIGDIFDGLIVLIGELIIIYPYFLIGDDDVNENVKPKKEKPIKVSMPKYDKYKDQVEAIKKYKELLDKGVINEEEYNAKKKDILS